MAYCLRSLVQTLDQILHPHKHHKSWVLDHDHIPLIQSLFENATFLRDFLDNSSPLIQERIVSLEDQVMKAAEMAEDNLESHMTSQILLSPHDQSFMIRSLDLEQVIQVFEVAKQEVIKIMDEDQRSEYIMTHNVSSTRYLYSKNVVVGVAEDLILLKSWLISRASKLDIISIVGMGGTGKTTLARILYDEYSSNKYHFDCCAWVTISQSYNPRLILKDLLACVTGKTLNEMAQLDMSELIVTLYQTLFRRRYLIVLDDIWSCKAWDDVQRAFPQDNQGSRVILTTRETTVADYVNSNCHKMHFMNEEDSWELIRKKVFGEETCPRELEEVGKRIVLNCGGLPLALQVIGGLLSQSQSSKDFWEYVEYNVSSLITKTDDQFSGIFSWSFAHLPHYLKPCFLYMGAFPEDYEIPASKIIKLWVAEGFLYPIRDKSLEESAGIHLNALVDRNLIFVREREEYGKVKSYGIHDLLRDLCLRKAQEKKFLYVRDLNIINNLEDDTLSPRRVSIHASNSKQYLRSRELTSLARSLLLIGSATKDILLSLCFKFSLLRVLDVFQLSLSEFPGEFLQLVNLRYLAINIVNEGFVDRSISILRNLQTLIVTKIISTDLIVDLPQLRHLMFDSIHEYDYCSSPRDSFFNIHENLQSLSSIPPTTVIELLGKLPNLRELSIDCLASNEINVDLTCFHILETFYCSNGFFKIDGILIANFIFPDSLKHLTLCECGLSPTLLEAIGMLPNLQVLELLWDTFESTSWEPCEGGFRELQFLQIRFGSWNLTDWLANEIHFPVLKHLLVIDCVELKEIPSEIGLIPTLERIEVHGCLPSVHESARNILEEQCQFGNTLLQVSVGDPMSAMDEDDDDEEVDEE